MSLLLHDGTRALTFILLEQVNIEEMPMSVHYMVPVVTVYSKGKKIKDVKNLSLKIVDIVHEGRIEGYWC